MSSAKGVDRRRLLRGLLGGAGLAFLGPGCGEQDDQGQAAGRKRVGIVGGGAAGVMTAWLLDGAFDVVLFEAAGELGGNVQHFVFEQGGSSAIIDTGAQYFHPGPYPTYVRLLELLGLYGEGDSEGKGGYSSPSSISIFQAGEATPRFVSPIFPGRTWPLTAPWNEAGIGAFSSATSAIKSLDQSLDWSVSVSQWLAGLNLASEVKEGTLLPWIASLNTGDIERTRGLSALAILIFLARAAPSNPLSQVSYFTMVSGLGEALRRMVAQCSSLEVRVGARVLGVTRAEGRLRVAQEGGKEEAVDALVFACPPEPCAKLLEGLQGAQEQQAAVQGVEMFDARLALHRDPIYAPADPEHWSFLNCKVEGEFCEASMQLGVAVKPLPSGPVGLWKSWVTHRAQAPGEVLHEVSFRHILPSPAGIASQQKLAQLQGQGGLWFAGGWTLPFDAQETALLSALTVAEGLGAGGSAHGAALAAALKTAEG